MCSAFDCLLVNRPRVASAVGVLNADGGVVAAPRSDSVAAGPCAVGVVDVLRDVAVAVDAVMSRGPRSAPDAVALVAGEVSSHVVDCHAPDAERTASREVAAEQHVLIRLDVCEVCH